MRGRSLRASSRRVQPCRLPDRHLAACRDRGNARRLPGLPGIYCGASPRVTYQGNATAFPCRAEFIRPATPTPIAVAIGCVRTSAARNGTLDPRTPIGKHPASKAVSIRQINTLIAVRIIQRARRFSRKAKILIPCSGLQIAKLRLCIAIPLGPPSILLRALTSLNMRSGPTVVCTMGD